MSGGDRLLKEENPTQNIMLWVMQIGFMLYEGK